MNSRNKILTKVKKALNNKLDKEESLPDIDKLLKSKILSSVPSNKAELINQFQEELIKVNAEFIHVNDLKEASVYISQILKNEKEIKIATTNQKYCLEVKTHIDNLNENFIFEIANDYLSEERKKIISNIPISIVNADYAVSEIASLVFFYDNSKTSYPHFLCDFIIALVDFNKLLPNQFKLIEIIDEEKAENMVFVSGPSRTADIEKVLVLGAHGPRRMLVILVDN